MRAIFLENFIEFHEVLIRIKRQICIWTRNKWRSQRSAGLPSNP